MYLSAATTRSWVAQVRDRVTASGPVEVAVLPSFPLLESTAYALRDTGIHWGAQDCAASGDGAQTGEVAASVLAELGCSYVEVGHAERRRLFGEDLATIVAKSRQVVEAGMTPLYCVGEEHRGSAPEAADECAAEVEQMVASVPPLAQGAPLVLAYEPIWAIGAPCPAPADYAGVVCASLRERIRRIAPATRVLYGGAAGPGTFAGLAGRADGLFLGRFAHDPEALGEVVREVRSAGAGPTAANAVG